MWYESSSSEEDEDTKAEGSYECAQLLLQKGAKAAASDDWLQTPLMYSICTQRENMVRLMTEYKCEINFKDKQRKSAVHYCCNHTDDKCLKVLVEKGANMNAQDAIGRTLLWLSAQKDGRGHLMKALLNAGCSVDLHDEREKRSPLQVAILYADDDRMSYVETLIDAGASTNHVDAFLQTPLMSVIKRLSLPNKKACETDVKVAKLLLENGALVNYISEGETWFQARGSALSLAVEANSLDLVQLLLDAGGDPEIDGGQRLTQGVNDNVVTPLLLAAFHNFKDITRHLILYGCKMDTIGQIRLAGSYQKITPFRCALERSNLEIAELIVIAGYNLQEEHYLFRDGDVPEVLLYNMDFWRWLCTFSQTPKTLILQCRRAILKFTGKSIIHKVQKLPLPKRLKDFLLYKDVTKD